MPKRRQFALPRRLAVGGSDALGRRRAALRLVRPFEATVPRRERLDVPQMAARLARERVLLPVGLALLRADRSYRLAAAWACFRPRLLVVLVIIDAVAAAGAEVSLQTTIQQKE